MQVSTYWQPLFKKIGYYFNSLDLLEQALTHRSMRSCHNERLEFLGDAILNYVIADVLYTSFPQAKEGQLTRLRADLVCKDALAKLADSIDLEKFLILGAGELKSGGHKRASIKADAMESLIAAVEKDSNFEQTKAVILFLYKDSLENLTLKDIKKDPKTELQEFQQAKGADLPSYEVLSITGQAHDQIFTIKCSLKELPEPTIGIGKSRRRAEQDAADLALEKLRKLKCK